jgi:hypothetical protein
MKLTFLFIGLGSFFTLVFSQEKDMVKLIERTEKFWSVDWSDEEGSEPPETNITYFNEVGLDTLSLIYSGDSLAQMTRTEYDSFDREKKFTRLTGEGQLISSVDFHYKQKKNKTHILITDETGDVFSKEIEIRDAQGKVIEHRINYVQEKIRSVNKYEYDEQGREIGYFSYDGKRLDFFITQEYNEQGFVSMERMGVEPNGEDNLVSKFVYTKLDERGNWLEREEWQNDELIERTTREIFYR